MTYGALCHDCDYEIHEAFLQLSRFCFATVGGTCSAGQTVWFAMAHHMIQHGRFPSGTVFVQTGPKDTREKIDLSIRDIIEYGERPPATTIGYLPHPSELFVRDLAGAQTLVNLFDFAGEYVMVCNTSSAPRFECDDPVKRRLLNMDAYFFFIDISSELDEQLRVFDVFYSQLKASKGPRSDVSEIPIAICVPRLDTIPELCDAVRAIAQDAAQRDEFAFDTNTAANRSHACLNGIIHASQLGKQLSSIGHKRFLFFPMASFGSNGMERLRTHDVKPFGVVEPLIWLLNEKGLRMTRVSHRDAT